MLLTWWVEYRLQKSDPFHPRGKMAQLRQGICFSVGKRGSYHSNLQHAISRLRSVFKIYASFNFVQDGAGGDSSYHQLFLLYFHQLRCQWSHLEQTQLRKYTNCICKQGQKKQMRICKMMFLSGFENGSDDILVCLFFLILIHLLH